MNYDYITSSMQDGIEELEKIKNSANTKTLTESELKVRIYAMLLDVFRGFNLRESNLKVADFNPPSYPPKEILELFSDYKE